MKATKEKEETTTNKAVEDGNIDQIRDILFGVQVRDFEKRFAELDKRFNDELTNNRNETQKRFSKLESLFEKEMGALSERIYNEQDSRTSDVKGLSEDLKIASQNISKEIARLSDQNAKNDTELRKNLVELSESMVSLIQEKQKEMSVALENKADDLQDSKADRKALANAFQGIVELLSDDDKNADSQ